MGLTGPLDCVTMGQILPEVRVGAYSELSGAGMGTFWQMAQPQPMVCGAGCL